MHFSHAIFTRTMTPCVYYRCVICDGAYWRVAVVGLSIHKLHFRRLGAEYANLSLSLCLVYGICFKVSF